MKEEDVGVPNPRDGAQVWGIHKVDVLLGLQEVGDPCNGFSALAQGRGAEDSEPARLRRHNPTLADGLGRAPLPEYCGHE